MTDPDDDALLARLRRVTGVVDPVPADLLFTAAVAGLEFSGGFEVCRRAAPLVGVVSFRGEEQTTRVTFESASLTIMLECSDGQHGTVRLDGWLAPPFPCTIELRTAGGPLTLDTDEGGRFAAPQIVHGEVQLRVRPADRQADGFRTVVTPSFIL